jgi:hypothetical protein
LTKEDYKRREKLINLIALPEEITEKIEPYLKTYHIKDWNYEGIYFRSLQDRLRTIYNKDKVVSDIPEVKKKKKIQLKLM